MLPRTVHLSCALALTTCLAGQGGRLVLQASPAGAQTPAGQVESGVAVQMFESPTLDRFVRKAHQFLGREDYAGVIKVLQDVVEGRVQAESLAPQTGSSNSGVQQALGGEDPTHAVFSNDGRLFKPVRRLCQELLASLPVSGLALYEEMYEVAADRAYREALERLDVAGLIATYDRYFVTLASAKALAAAGDLLMHEGRFRSAVQAFRTLLEVYPQASRARVAGLSDVYAEVRIAVCFVAMGEGTKALDQLRQISERYSDAVIRLAGELVAISDLATHELFVSVAPRSEQASELEPAVLRSLAGGVVPVWQYICDEPDPYRRPSGSSSPRFIVSNGDAPAAPWYNRHNPGSSVRFESDALVFMNHFQVRVHDLGSGLVQRHSDGAIVPPKPRQGKARVRVPVYDYVGMRVSGDDDRYYCVRGPSNSPAMANLEPILRNNIAAVDRASLASVWSTDDWKAEGSNYNDVTFLATPAVFGKRLLVPVLVDGAYGLQGIDAETGEPLFRVLLHAGGSELARAPSVPVVVHEGTAFVLTNAGTVAAVDALTGDLHWVRKYERTHPYRPTHRSKSAAKNNQFARQYFRHVSLSGFVPSDLIAIEGRIIVAPSDGAVLMCLDGVSGEPLWILSKPAGSDVYLVGHDSRHIYLGGQRLMCVDHRTGVRVWDKDFPEAAWSGRGLVTEERVVVPGVRCVYWVPSDGSGRWRKADLPIFSIGKSPLSGKSNLFASGPYLVACYDGGIEVFASPEALGELAMATTDPEDRANLLVQMGDLLAAIELLGPMSTDETLTAGERRRLARRTLALVRDVVLERAAESARDEGFALLDRAKEWMTSKNLNLQWQLLRVEMLQALGDTDAAAREQDRLDEMMQGRQQ